MRAAIAAATVAAVFVAVGCTSTDDNAVSTSSTPASTTVHNPATALDAFVARESDIVVHSDPVMVRAIPVAVVGSRQGDNDQVITVLSLAEENASPLADLVLPEPSFDLADDLPVVVSDVTGDGAAEFLVRVTAADTNPGVIVSNDGGSWRLVPASGDPDDVYLAREPEFTNGQLTTQFNDCSPTCASGRTTTITWTYDQEGGHFING